MEKYLYIGEPFKTLAIPNNLYDLTDVIFTENYTVQEDLKRSPNDWEFFDEKKLQGLISEYTKIMEKYFGNKDAVVGSLESILYFSITGSKDIVGFLRDQIQHYNDLITINKKENERNK